MLVHAVVGQNYYIKQLANPVALSIAVNAMCVDVCVVEYMCVICGVQSIAL